MQIIKNRIECELTLTNRNQETLERQVHSFVQRIVAFREAQLGLNLLAGHFFVATEDIAFRTVCETEFVHLHHLAVRDQAYQGIFGYEVDTLLKRVL